VIARILRFVRFSHTIFALPFAAGAMLVAAGGWPGWQLVLLIVLCMVFARTSAMTFNRLADWEIDKRNPRTADRHKLVSKPLAITLLLGTSAAFVATTSYINALCFWLSPVALVIIFFYSLTKRFTSFSHLFLGLALSVAPVGAWFAVRGADLVSSPWLITQRFDQSPFVLAAGVLLWVAGFDIIYATQDHEFDRKSGLNSLVVRLGVPRSLQVAQALHWAMFVLLIVFSVFARLGPAFFASLVLIGAALVYEHASAAKLDVAAINRAFFASNAFVGLVFVVAIAADLLLRRA
jgi:4-hydroxybenzoate polyprenyltransferase